MHRKTYKFTPVATNSRTSCNRLPTMACIVKNFDICLMFVITDNGRYDDEAILHQENFYRAKYELGTASACAYVHTAYEPSALNRVLRTHKPGAEYQSDTRSVQTSYMGNAVSTALRLRVDPDDRSLTADGYYAANELSAHVLRTKTVPSS